MYIFLGTCAALLDVVYKEMLDAWRDAKGPC